MPLTIWARGSAETPPDLPRPWPRSTLEPMRLRMFMPNKTRRVRLYSSSIRCPGRAWTTSSRPIRQHKIASRLWSNWLQIWAAVLSCARPRHLPPAGRRDDGVTGARSGGDCRVVNSRHWFGQALSIRRLVSNHPKRPCTRAHFDGEPGLRIEDGRRDPSEFIDAE